jgi:hypothetical protein
VECGFLDFLRTETPESLVHGWKRAMTAVPGSVRTCKISEGYWQDIGTLEAYDSLRESNLSQNALRLDGGKSSP